MVMAAQEAEEKKHIQVTSLKELNAEIDSISAILSKDEMLDLYEEHYLRAYKMSDADDPEAESSMMANVKL